MDRTKNQEIITQFIQNNWQRDIIDIAFELSKSDLPKGFILNQINGKQKAKLKLPFLFDNQEILYPSKLSMEQASSELTARFKASLVKGEVLIDLTGGFGIDDYFFAHHFKQVYHCELNKELSETVTHNMKVLAQNNVECLHGNSLDLLKDINSIDVIYVDPARRNDANQKVFRFEIVYLMLLNILIF